MIYLPCVFIYFETCLEPLISCVDLQSSGVPDGRIFLSGLVTVLFPLQIQTKKTLTTPETKILPTQHDKKMNTRG